MNILTILQLLQQIPAIVDVIGKIITAIHTAPGTPEHDEAINSSVTIKTEDKK